MTQHNQTQHDGSPARMAHLNIRSVWRRSLPVQSLCWLSSFSLLSGGFVFAQTDAPIDNIVPTVENAQPSVVNKLKKDHPAQESERSQNEFSQRRARLRQRLGGGEISHQPARHQLKNEDSPPTVVIRSRRPLEASVPETRARRLRAKLDAAPYSLTITRVDKPKVESATPTTPQLTPEKVEHAAQSTQSNSTVSTTTNKPKDYNNALIDPTDYSNGATQKYVGPNSVVITERSSGCRTILGQGESSSLCAKPLANNDTQQSHSQVPSWIRRSENVHLADVLPVHSSVSTNENNTRWHPTRSTVRQENNDGGRLNRIAPRAQSNDGGRLNRIAYGGITKSEYHPNRFIPKDLTPSTTVNSAASIPVPTSGTLPAPMTADNLAPRPSTVAYNIPLASTLPQVAFDGGYGAKIAYGVMGMMFPLSVPAPITSLFGWRVHPITGDRRFHSGTDLGAAIGTPVLAANTGQVEIADWVGGYGLTVIINHTNAQQTLYGHMSQILVQPGQVVQKGTVIGLVGSTGNSTGPHLHFEMRQLTPEGWVAVDPATQLDYALNQLVQTLHTAQAVQQPGS
ncbi:MAG: M23 family metallopeptidase [Rhizonema sp. NSF051]|nr:M23 family metallopeptidase [Rhizonema sp. NSF051]